MEKYISCVDQNLEETLGALQRYLQSDISVSEPFSVNAAGQGENYEAVTTKVRVKNSAPSRDGWGEIVFLGVGLVITCAGSEELYQRLKNSLQPYSIRRWTPIKERAIIWNVNSLFEAEETGDSCYNSGSVGGTALFPGETTTYHIELPLVSLPFVSIKVTGFVSPANLFQFGQVFEGLEKWVRPISVSDTKSSNFLMCANLSA